MPFQISPGAGAKYARKRACKAGAGLAQRAQVAAAHLGQRPINVIRSIVQNTPVNLNYSGTYLPLIIFTNILSIFSDFSRCFLFTAFFYDHSGLQITILLLQPLPHSFLLLLFHANDPLFLSIFGSYFSSLQTILHLFLILIILLFFFHNHIFLISFS